MSGAPPPTFVQTIGALLVRHAATYAAGILAAWGVIQPSQQTEFVSLGVSAGAWGLTVAWSVYQKSQTKPKTA